MKGNSLAVREVTILFRVYLLPVLRDRQRNETQRPGQSGRASFRGTLGECRQEVRLFSKGGKVRRRER